MCSREAGGAPAVRDLLQLLAYSLNQKECRWQQCRDMLQAIIFIKNKTYLWLFTQAKVREAGLCI